MLAGWSAVLVAALVAALWPITAAQAHDALKSSTPKKNAKVATVDKVRLEFTASVKFPKIIWLLAIAGLILQRFWSYWVTLL
jgi:methionine-rich copper-binding protein CopC